MNVTIINPPAPAPTVAPDKVTRIGRRTAREGCKHCDSPVLWGKAEWRDGTTRWVFLDATPEVRAVPVFTTVPPSAVHEHCISWPKRKLTSRKRAKEAQTLAAAAALLRLHDLPDLADRLNAIAEQVYAGKPVTE